MGQQMDVPLPLGARVDQISSAGRLARMRSPDAGDEAHAVFTGKVRARVVDRVWFVGSNAGNAPRIEAGFFEMLALLDGHLSSRPYLFGGRPAFGDFGLWGQIYEMWTDPTAGALIGGGAPHVLDSVGRMLWPRAEGAFETWAGLEPTMMPILTQQVGRSFMPWTAANEKAIADGKEEFSVTLGDHSGPKSRKNITRDRSACCAPNTRPYRTRPRSIPFWTPRAALPDCAAETHLSKGNR